jgi:exosortase A-associated hydrolase 2
MLSASFLDSRAGRIFCTRWEPDQASRSSAQPQVLILPPFGEEMNKSRHLLAALGRAAAESGACALLPDLYGTGDSEGDFSEATLSHWRADVDACIRHLGQGSPLHLVGMRFGALLAAEAAQRHRVAGLVLVQPVTDGRNQLNQLLRLRLAAAMAGGGERERSSDLRARLAAGEVLEFAGYGVNGELAEDLEGLAMEALAPPACTRVSWVDVVADAAREPGPAVQRVLESWSRAGTQALQERVVCDAFWAAQELVQCPGIGAPLARALAD